MKAIERRVRARKIEHRDQDERSERAKKKPISASKRAKHKAIGCTRGVCDRTKLDLLNAACRRTTCAVAACVVVKERGEPSTAGCIQRCSFCTARQASYNAHVSTVVMSQALKETQQARRQRRLRSREQSACPNSQCGMMYPASLGEVTRRKMREAFTTACAYLYLASNSLWAG